jgi:hypothetical protein
MTQNQVAEGEADLARVVVPINRIEGELSTTAAQWLARFYPSVGVEVTEQQITLSSQLSEAELHRIWEAALFNERAWVEAASRRRQVLESLLQ